MRAPDPKLIEFLAGYEPRVVRLALTVREMVLEEVPDASEVIFDAHYAVSIAYTFTERWMDGFCHVVVYRKHVNLGFHRGAELPDPKRLLEGSGKLVRHISIKDREDLRKPHVREFLRLALNGAERPKEVQVRTIVKTSVKRRPGRD